MKARLLQNRFQTRLPRRQRNRQLRMRYGGPSAGAKPHPAARAKAKDGETPRRRGKPQRGKPQHGKSVRQTREQASGKHAAKGGAKGKGITRGKPARKADPDSPFAVLGKLKETMKQDDGERV